MAAAAVPGASRAASRPPAPELTGAYDEMGRGFRHRGGPDASPRRVRHPGRAAWDAHCLGGHRLHAWPAGRAAVRRWPMLARRSRGLLASLCGADAGEADLFGVVGQIIRVRRRSGRGAWICLSIRPVAPMLAKPVDAMPGTGTYVFEPSGTAPVDRVPGRRRGRVGSRNERPMTLLPRAVAAVKAETPGPTAVIDGNVIPAAGGGWTSRRCSCGSPRGSRV